MELRIMKASEIAEDGWYWTVGPFDWAIVHVSGGWVTYPDGSIENVARLKFDYEVQGPIEHPKAVTPYSES